MLSYPNTRLPSQLEITHGMKKAVRDACALLSLPKTGDEAESVARKILELAQSGERDPKRLCVDAVKCFQA
jgi:hypothetical protein